MRLLGCRSARSSVNLGGLAAFGRMTSGMCSARETARSNTAANMIVFYGLADTVSIIKAEQLAETMQKQRLGRLLRYGFDHFGVRLDAFHSVPTVSA
jgi:hypothetical protein